jgi:ribonuclease HII
VKKKQVIVGIDEVGRGCWAGPLVAGAVILDSPIMGLRDSKKLSRMQRERLATIINDEAVYVGLGWVWPEEIDSSGLTASVSLAMRRALESIQVRFDEIIIDGNYNFLPDIETTRSLIKADDSVPEVSAASIVAKVARDTYMATAAHLKYPEYGFDRHVGYGTAAHVKALAEYGVTDLHRKSFNPIRDLVVLSNA